MKIQKIAAYLVDLLKGKNMEHPKNWRELQSIEDLERCIEVSFSQPIIIFKHSTTCGISASAKYELITGKDNLGTTPFYYLDLLRYRNVSNAIAEQLTITHQSPQIIVVNKGEATYNSSHMAIQTKAIANELT